MTITGKTAEPLVSVVVPTYNRAGIIGETIENIFQQTYPNIELIIVDDGSTDNTESVLKSYGSRVRWAIQKNAGPAAARNRGIAMARGEIVAFQDSDDVWHPTKLARQVSLMERAGPSVVCCLCNSIVQLPGVEVRSFENAPVSPALDEGVWLNVTEVLATRFILFNQAIAVRAEVLKRLGGFDESFRLMEDADLALRLSLEGPWSFIREPLATRQAKIERTLGHEATEQKVCDYEIRIQERTLLALRSNPRWSDLVPLVQKELQRSRRRMRAIKFSESSSFAASVIGRGLAQIERYRMAAYRRAPWFPQMRISAVESVES